MCTCHHIVVLNSRDWQRQLWLLYFTHLYNMTYKYALHKNTNWTASVTPCEHCSCVACHLHCYIYSFCLYYIDGHKVIIRVYWYLFNHNLVAIPHIFKMTNPTHLFCLANEAWLFWVFIGTATWPLKVQGPSKVYQPSESKSRLQ